MEVFSIFATLSLKDLLSGPLAHIRQGLGSFDTGIASLGSRMGNLALSMAPLAFGAGAVLGAFGKCVSTAAGFEDQMAKVAAISRASTSELAALEAKARDLGATTQFTASEVAQAEQYLAMAGFSVEQNIAALPGVLNLAAATATDLGRAADISSDIMGAFGLQASEMTRVADTLALTCAQANTDMEKLGDTMKYCAPVAKKAGLSLEETAAMAGLLGDVGIKGSQAGTTLKAMLNKMAAPTSEATRLLQKLGVTTKDAAGNLRSPIQVLGELTSKMKGMGSADQIEAMKKIVGEEAMAGFSELLNQADGAGKLMGKIENLLKGEGTAAEMAARQNDSLGGDMRSLGSAFESVQLTVGKIFIPSMRSLATGVTSVLRVFDKFSQSKFGSALIKIAGALATAIVAITAFSAGMWAFSRLAPMVSSVFGTIKAAMFGLGAPVWALIAVAGILYVAWKNNFGGIATVVARWCRNIKLLFDGVCAVFETLKGTTGEIRGELAKDIKAAGLVGLVTNVGKMVFRIREFFSGIWDGLDFNAVINAFMPAVRKIRQLFDTVGNAISKVFGSDVSIAANSARSFGEVIGSVLSWSLEGLATGITVVVNGIDLLISFLRMICAIFTGDFSTAAEMAGNIWQNFCDSLMNIADWLGVGDWIRNAWSGIEEFFASLVNNIKSIWSGITAFFANIASGIASVWNGVINLFLNIGSQIGAAVSGIIQILGSINPIELLGQAFAGVTEFLAGIDFVSGFQTAWDAVSQFFAGLNLFESGARLIETLKEGVLSAASSLIEGVKGVFSSIRNLLPFSDAKEGPLSELTLSGSRIMTTLGEGVGQGKDALKESVQNALGEVNSDLQGWQQGLSPLEVAAANEAVDPSGGMLADMPQISQIQFPVSPVPEISQMMSPDLKVFGKEGFGEGEPFYRKVSLPAGPQVIPPEIPQFRAPEIAIPEPPVGFPQDNAMRAETGQPQNTQHISITIGQITLPDVRDAESFLSSLKGALQNEIGQFEGATA